MCELWTLSKAKNKSYCMHQSLISSEKKGAVVIKDFHQAKLCGTLSGSSICRRRLASFRVKNTLCM